VSDPDYDLEALRNHVKREFKEWLEAIGTDKEAGELVDLANEAYFTWRRRIIHT